MSNTLLTFGWDNDGRKAKTVCEEVNDKWQGSGDSPQPVIGGEGGARIAAGGVGVGFVEGVVVGPPRVEKDTAPF